MVKEGTMDKGREGMGILEILTYYLAVYGHHSKPHEEKTQVCGFLPWPLDTM